MTRSSSDSHSERPGADYVTLADAVALAIEHHRSGRLTEAEVLYRRILEAAPDCVEALHFLGLIEFQSGEAQAGIDRVRRAVALGPGYAAAHNNLGNLLKASGQAAQAEHHYRQAIASDPGFVDAYSNLGSVLRGRSLPEEAEAAYREALRLRPDHPQALNNLATLLMRRGALAEARALLEHLIEVHPSFFQAGYNLGELLDRQGGAGEGSAVSRQALDEAVNAHVQVARVLRDQNRADDALRILQKARELAPDNGIVLYDLGLLLQGTGEAEAAAEVFDHWRSIAPEDPVARHMASAARRRQVPSRASDGYIAATFDDLADHFDAHLLRLGYRGPQLVAEQLRGLFDEEASLRILDAGCGTGLVASELRPLAARLMGVDLSNGMLERARGLGLYDALVTAELTAWLAATDERFDLVVSADTFIYFGDLGALLAGIRRVLLPGGRLIATVELDDQAGDDGYRLCPHGRYSHSSDYIRQSLLTAGLEPQVLQRDILRNELQEPVPCLVLTAGIA